MVMLAALVGCFDGPPPLEDWQGEILTHARLMEEPTHGWPRVYKGANAVLSAQTRWGKLPFVTDMEQFGEFGIALPAVLRAGSTLDASYRRGYLRLGGQVLSYDSREVTGTIRVVAVTQDNAVLDLDVVARSPRVDLGGVGERPVRGTITATFKAGPEE